MLHEHTAADRAQLGATKVFTHLSSQNLQPHTFSFVLLVDSLAWGALPFFFLSFSSTCSLSCGTDRPEEGEKHRELERPQGAFGSVY